MYRTWPVTIENKPLQGEARHLGHLGLLGLIFPIIIPYICNHPILRTNLDPLRHAGAVHATGHVHRVPPDVVLGLPGTDHARHHRPDVEP